MSTNLVASYGKPVLVTFTVEEMDMILRLFQSGLWGASPAEVVERIVAAHLRALRQSGEIQPTPSRRSNELTVDEP